ncbi:MAG: hypothetical protein SGI84_06790 [Gemmatimonadota bacterium]|nr:hypothetical protein [Gemmatimonadota bacterium]
MLILVIPERQRLMELERASRIVALDRGMRRAWLVLGLLVLGWNLIGLVLIGFAMAMPNPELGARFVAAGPLVAYIGMFVTVTLQLLRMSDRGYL